jgi:Icc-related predicted phosphoesterase
LNRETQQRKEEEINKKEREMVREGMNTKTHIMVSFDFPKKEEHSQTVHGV